MRNILEFKRRQEETVAKEKERLERSERVKRREGLFSLKSKFKMFFFSLKNVQIVFVVVQQQQVLMDQNFLKIAIHHQY